MKFKQRKNLLLNYY